MKKGFTIVETLIAIAILTAAIIGAMGAVSSGISSYNSSKDRITAYFLAQEAIEQIRNIRDENRLNNRHWLNGIGQSSSDPCYFGNACMVDPVLTAATTICTGGPGNCPPIKQSSESGMYGYYSTWTPTIFTRQIILSSISADEIVVTVTVNWTKGGIGRQFRVSENLFNWQ